MSFLLVRPSLSTKMARGSGFPSTKLNLILDANSIDFSSSAPSVVISEVATWRQYVVLAVVCGVILDIVLGSPLANLALAPMKRASGIDSEDDDDETSGNNGSLFSTVQKSNEKEKSRERIDSEAVAQAALDKAKYSLELRRFLDENKTDQQLFLEALDKVDKEMDKVDKELDKRREN